MPKTKSTEKKRDANLNALRKKVSEETVERVKTAEQDGTTLSPLARLVANQLIRDSHSPEIVTGFIRLIEFTLIATVGILIHTFLPAEDNNSRTLGYLFAAAMALASSLLLHLSGAYNIRLLRWPSLVMLRLQLVLFITSLATAFAYSALTPSIEFPVTDFIAIYLLTAAALVVARYSLAEFLHHWARNGFMERRAVIVGGGQAAKDLIRSLEQQPDNDIRICGIFDDRKSQRSPDVVAGYPKLGTFAELVEFARITKLDMLIIALPTTAEERILMLLRKLWILPVDIRIASHSNDMRFRPRSYSNIGKVEMLDVFDKPIRDWESVGKRAFDIIFALIALTLVWPIMLAAAIAVKLNSKGPIFFIQKRHGFNNEIVDVLKFRSMYTELGDPTAKKAVTKHDPRVTPVGRFIRRTSIDELPQLFNVLRGSLSLVGPRPHAIQAQSGEIKYYEAAQHYFARHRVKPGVTGWAQIKGHRGEIDNDEKIKQRTNHDLYYIENWSLWFDFKILVMTPISLLRNGDVY